MIVFLTKDLFFMPVLQSAGARQGVSVESLLSLDSPKAMGVEAGEVTTCVIDLAGVESADLEALVVRLRGTFPQARLAAFGPHVHADKLSKASELGVESVLTRGQVTKQIDALITAWGEQ